MFLPLLWVWLYPAQYFPPPPFESQYSAQGHSGLCRTEGYADALASANAASELRAECERANKVLNTNDFAVSYRDYSCTYYIEEGTTLVECTITAYGICEPVEEEAPKVVKKKRPSKLKTKAKPKKK